MNAFMKSGLIIGCLLIGGGSALAAEPWSYSGATGPAHWAYLKADYAACSGGQQSPIALSEENAIPSVPQALVIRWKPFHPTLLKTNHTIRIQGSKNAGYAMLGSTRYKLKHLQFRHGSDHVVNGKRFEGELQLVHHAATGAELIVSLLIEAGPSHGLIEALWNEIPETDAAIKMPYPIAATDLLPEKRSFFRYQGSQTTPPCSETVTWHVLRQPISLSRAQIARLEQHSPNSFRPLQRLNRRYVLFGAKD